MTLAERFVLAAIVVSSLDVRGEVLAVRMGSRPATGVLSSSIAAGDLVYAEVRCSRGEEVVVELTMLSDADRDGVVQDGERTRVPAVTVKDNGPGDLERAAGKIVVELARLPGKTSSLVVRVAAGSSVQRAALRLAVPHEPWWRRLARFRDVGPFLRAPGEAAAGICVFDVAGATSRRIDVAGDASHPALSADERLVAYAVRDGSMSSVRVAEVATGTQRASIENADWPAWLPGDGAIAFVRGGEVMSFDLRNGMAAALGLAADEIVAAAPELVVARRAGGVRELWRVDGGDAVMLHFGAPPEPRLAPDQERFISMPKRGQLVVVDRAGAAKPIATGRVFDPRWSPSGRSIVFACP